VFVMLGAGLLDYALRKVEIPLAPIALTLVLGPIMERSLNGSLQMSQGSFSIFAHSPMALTLLSITAVAFILMATKSLYALVLTRAREGLTRHRVSK
jgi:TctA family transporter